MEKYGKIVVDFAVVVVAAALRRRRRRPCHPALKYCTYSCFLNILHNIENIPKMNFVARA